jgi:hypothetical protein
MKARQSVRGFLIGVGFLVGTFTMSGLGLYGISLAFRLALVMVCIIAWLVVGWAISDENREREMRRQEREAHFARYTSVELDECARQFWAVLFNFVQEHGRELADRYWRDSRYGYVVAWSCGRVQIMLTFEDLIANRVTVQRGDAEKKRVWLCATQSLNGLTMPFNYLGLVPGDLRGVTEDELMQRLLPKQVIPDSALSQARLGSADAERGVSQVVA